MLPLLVLGIVTPVGRSEPPTPKRTAADVVRVLTLLDGFPKTTDPSGTTGILHHGDEAAYFSMWTRYGPNGDPKTGWISAIDLTTKLVFPEEVHTFELSLKEHSQEATSPTCVVSHLGRTATVEKHVEFAEPLSPDRLRADLDDFWRTAEGYARAHAGSFVPDSVSPPSVETLSDRLVLDKADPVSLRRATNAWGWTWRKSWGGSFSGWTFPIDLDGRLVWVSENRNGSFPSRTSFRLSSQVSAPDGTPSTGTGEASPKADGAVTLSSMTNGTANAQCAIDLGKGLTLADLRSRFEAYGATLARLGSGPKP